MILYDAQPQVVQNYPLAKFEGNRLRHKDRTVFESFEKAKKYTRETIKEKIYKLEKQLAVLEATTIENCPTIDNPFE